LIVDSSALLALVFGEAEAQAFAEAMIRADRLRMSAASWLEAAMVLDRRGDAIARHRFDDIVREMGIEIGTLTAAHAAIAREAWRSFGAGRGAEGGLNIGDCLAYAFARGEGEPLLSKRPAFAHTDIEPALKE
jgi:ribonuclease VapC